MRNEYLIEFVSSPESEKLAAQILFCGEFVCQLTPTKNYEELKISFYDPILENGVLKQELSVNEFREILDEVCQNLIDSNSADADLVE